ncbi:MAG: HlyD family efflux transporter periplasmic adaptor subunit [Candidatus Zixiibacteriota bacterium]
MKRIMSIVMPAMLLLAGCGNDTDLIGGSGLIETTESVISAETAGRVVQHRFDEGTEVSAGDTLLVIDPSNLELELVSARAGLDVIKAQLATVRLQVKQAATSEEFVRAEFERVDRLMKAGTATKKQFDQAEFELNQATLAHQSAEAQVRTLQANLSKAESDIARLERRRVDCYPVSPVSGVVTEKFIEPGEFLAPGKPIVRVSRLDTVTVKVYLSTADFAGVKLGDAAVVSTESGGQEFRGTVVWTSDQAEFTPKNVQTEQARADLVYAVKVSVPNPDRNLKVAMPVFVRLEK